MIKTQEIIKKLNRVETLSPSDFEIIEIAMERLAFLENKLISLKKM